ncbi:MAG: hypothetical protein S4CHLAM102_04740 [Chlamydiia bacterium]|nr:hypothetical protein [Chlamydiia bacterium]
MGVAVKEQETQSINAINPYAAADSHREKEMQKKAIKEGLMLSLTLEQLKATLAEANKEKASKGQVGSVKEEKLSASDQEYIATLSAKFDAAKDPKKMAEHARAHVKKHHPKVDPGHYVYALLGATDLLADKTKMLENSWKFNPGIARELYVQISGQFANLGNKDPAVLDQTEGHLLNMTNMCSTRADAMSTELGMSLNQMIEKLLGANPKAAGKFAAMMQENLRAISCGQAPMAHNELLGAAKQAHPTDEKKAGALAQAGNQLGKSFEKGSTDASNQYLEKMDAMMLSVQNLQAACLNYLGEQSKKMANFGNVSVKIAEASVKLAEKNMQDLLDAQKHQHDADGADTAGRVVGAVISVIFGAIFAPVTNGASLVLGLAFAVSSATGLTDKAVNAIANDIEKANPGMNKQEAHGIANIIMAVISAVISAGVCAGASALSSGAKAATDIAVNAGEAAAKEGAEEAAKQVATKGMSAMTKYAFSQVIQSFAMFNPTSDFIMAKPLSDFAGSTIEEKKKNQMIWAMVMGVVTSLALAAGSGFAMNRAFAGGVTSGVTESSGIFNKLVKTLSGHVVLLGVFQGLAKLSQASSSFYQYLNLQQQADIQKKIAGTKGILSLSECVSQLASSVAQNSTAKMGETYKAYQQLIGNLDLGAAEEATAAVGR